MGSRKGAKKLSRKDWLQLFPLPFTGDDWLVGEDTITIHKMLNLSIRHRATVGLQANGPARRELGTKLTLTSQSNLTL